MDSNSNLAPKLLPNFPARNPIIRPHRKRNVFGAKIPVHYETDEWLLTTANDLDALDSSLRLRHEVFCEELQNRALPSGIEKDALDDLCDHLIIWDKRANRIAGTYRLLSSHFFKTFYSEEEFNLDRLLLDSPEPKLELGRACIRKEYRRGVVIQLLWRGIAQYMLSTQSRYLLGCSSLQTMDIEKMKRVSAWMRGQNAILDAASNAESSLCPRVWPRSPYRAPDPNVFSAAENSAPSSDFSTDEVPGLVIAYLSAGAKFAAEPAIDADFQCADFFTFLDREAMNPLFTRRYFRERA